MGRIRCKSVAKSAKSRHRILDCAAFVGDLIWNCWLWFWVKEIMRNLQKDYTIFFLIFNNYMWDQRTEQLKVHAQTCCLTVQPISGVPLSLTLSPSYLSHSNWATQVARQANYKRQDGTARHDTRRADTSRGEPKCWRPSSAFSLA